MIAFSNTCNKKIEIEYKKTRNFRNENDFKMYLKYYFSVWLKKGLINGLYTWLARNESKAIINFAC